MTPPITLAQCSIHPRCDVRVIAIGDSSPLRFMAKDEGTLAEVKRELAGEIFLWLRIRPNSTRQRYVRLAPGK